MTKKSGEKSEKNWRVQIKEARLALKLTQAEVAKKAGLNINYYARLERGEENPTIEKVEALMKALGITSLNM